MPTQTNRRRRTSHSNNGRRRSFSSSQKRSNTSGNNYRPSSRRRSSSRKLPTFDPSQFINTNPVESKVEVYEPKHDFSDFNLSNGLLKAIKDNGMETPSPIQDQIIPHVMKGRDVIGLAETGTGKTAAFLIPLIEKTLKSPKRQTLILTPTRELAIQVEDELRKLTANNRLHSVICVGGMNIRPQLQKLKRKNHFVIGTPGRVIDLIDRKAFRPEHVNTVVLDEADRMLDMGFVNDMRKIISRIPDTRETLLFSATMSGGTDKIAEEFLTDPVTVSVKKKEVTNSIAQDVVSYKNEDKFNTLVSLLNEPDFRRVIIFGAMKHSVEKLSKDLSRKGIKAESIHGNKSHNQRQQSLKAFKSGNAQVLVATDVAARGIHVDNVSHVINYDLPNTFDDYVHRIGRTGRADKRGIALTFIPENK